MTITLLKSALHIIITHSIIDNMLLEPLEHPLMIVGLLSAEVFSSFMEGGSFKRYLCDDTQGMLSLYEASFLSIEGENRLDEAREFSKKHLQEFVKQNKDQNLSTVAVSHALELPLHWRILRVEARWFIDVYRSKEDMNPTLLKFAELDFNMVQATHQEDIKQVSSSKAC